MNLLVDFGNTRVKAGLFEGKEYRDMQAFDSIQELLDYSRKQTGIRHCMVASVTEAHDAVLEELNRLFPTHIFTASTRLPFTNLYKSALTLGSDRIAASAGAWTLHPRRNVLTIDAGTCIKYNFVNDRDEYLGGAISPGIPMRLRSMHHYTARLPLLETDFSFEELTGTSTRDSMLCGAQMAAAFEVDEMISRYNLKYPGLIVMLTGGDAPYLGRQLKNRFFACRELLLHGLNTILQLHLEK